MTQDIVRRLGFLCLGTRFKRIGERFQADVARFIETQGFDVQPAQYTLLAAVDRNGPMTVNELVAALGISQPGVTRNLARLTQMGVVKLRRGADDQRQKTVELTKAGQHLVALSKRDVWPFIEAAVTELCAGLKGSLLDQLGAIEDGLAAQPLDQRAARRKAKRGR